jgi:chromosomal replication initiation ATPase DnaA
MKGLSTLSSSNNSPKSSSSRDPFFKESFFRESSSSSNSHSSMNSPREYSSRERSPKISPKNSFRERKISSAEVKNDDNLDEKKEFKEKNDSHSNQYSPLSIKNVTKHKDHNKMKLLIIGGPIGMGKSSVLGKKKCIQTHMYIYIYIYMYV